MMLHIYSEKLQKMLNFGVDGRGMLVPVGASPISGMNILFSWNNTVDGWIDNGWVNTGSRWVDNGWSNSGASWLDGNWNNTNNWTNNGWSNGADNWSDAGGGGGGCFITTACVEHRGLADDCYELQTLRQFRDALVEHDEGFRSKVLEYYRKAPLIIQAIDARDEKSEIYDALYDEMIKPCVDLLENGKTEEAVKLYLDYYEMLSKEYLES